MGRVGRAAIGLADSVGIQGLGLPGHSERGAIRS